jgi:hypothetical protein
MVGYDTAKSGTEADSELRSLVKRIADVRRYREKDLTTDTLLRRFKEVQRSAQSIAYHLSQIRLGGETLDRDWRAAQELVEGLWKEKSKELSYFDSRELDRVRRFLEDHPAYKAVYAEASEKIESFLFPGRLTVEELIELTRAELEKSLKTSIGKA